MSQERFKYPLRQEFCLPTFKELGFSCHDEGRCWAQNGFSGKSQRLTGGGGCALTSQAFYYSLVFIYLFKNQQLFCLMHAIPDKYHILVLDL